MRQSPASPSEPLLLQVCTGPVCSTHGTGELIELLEGLAPAARAALVLSTRHCFSQCQRQPPACPAVRLNGEWLCPGTPPQMAAAIAMHLLAAGA